MKSGVHLKTLFKFCSLLLTVLTVVLFYHMFRLSQCIPENMYVQKGETINWSNLVGLGDYDISKLKVKINAANQQEACFKLYGIIPIKSTTIVEIDNTSVIPCGIPIGISLESSAKDLPGSPSQSPCQVNGIGMMTFYNPVTKTYCALGHNMSDADSSPLATIRGGMILSAAIFDVTASTETSIGKLRGSFESTVLGDVLMNNDMGVFGKIKNRLPLSGKPISVGLKQDIELGEAQLLTTVNGTTPQYYDVEVTHISYSTDPNIIIRITDQELLSQTGGIVRGMSGSPLIQNGKLIGAVGYVRSGDPKVGYAVLAENMLTTMQKLP